MEIDLKLCNFAAEKASLLGACPQQGVGMKVKNKPWHSLNYTPHERQQAMGNIYTALNMGCKVFLSNTSPVFTFLKKLGVYVYSIQNDLSTSEINTPLTEEEKSHNRNIIYSMYNEKQFRSNFNYILSLF